MKSTKRHYAPDYLEGIAKKKEIQAYERLAFLDREDKLTKYSNVPGSYIPKSKFEDRTSNGLAKMIIRWLELNGHKAWRQSSEGRYRPGQQVVDVVGRTRLMKGQFLPGQNNGAADVCAILDGQFLAVEVKIGKDKQSEVQKQYQREVEDAGGLYYIAKSFGQFLEHYDKL